MRRICNDNFALTTFARPSPWRTILAYLIIAVALLIVIAPIVSLIPSRRDRALTRIIEAARAAGVSRQFVPHPDPGRGAGGGPVPPGKTLCAYRIQRRRADDWRRLPAVDWRLRHGADGWRWVSPPPEAMNEALCAWLTEAVRSLPADTEQVDEKGYVISVYLHEKEPEKGQAVLDFLEHCAGLPLHRPAGEGEARL